VNVLNTRESTTLYQLIHVDSNMTPQEYEIQRKLDKKAWEALWTCKDALVEAGPKWDAEAQAVNKILADNIPF
jgi:uncharacterized tellurite resistance protein B-like protein